MSECTRRICDVKGCQYPPNCEQPVDPGVPRPFEKQSLLERNLRAHLHHPQTFLAKADERIKKAAKTGDYETAAAIKKQKIAANLEMETWEHLLELYEKEFRSPSLQHATGEKAND